MNAPGTTPAIIASALIVVFGIIELGSSIGIVARYNKYQDVFRPSVGLSAFDIVVGLYAIAIGILCLFGIIRQRPALSKTGIICVAVLGVASIASLIAALVINSQAVGYVRGRLSYRMNSYIETDSSITIMDMIQNNYQCCGENLWLDWQRVGLGLSTTNSTITGAGRRRRRTLGFRSSPLMRVVRRRRQVVANTAIYGLPSTYTFNLPLSCCKNTGVSTGNSIGGYCVFNAGNSSVGFYVEGCIPPVASVMVVQITGLAIINMCLGILSVVLIPILIKMFPAAFDSSNPQNAQNLSDQRKQEQDYQNGVYYNNYGAPAAAPAAAPAPAPAPVPNPQTMYYAYPEPTYGSYAPYATYQ